jgi:simple sugar transport system permease protein
MKNLLKRSEFYLFIMIAVLAAIITSFNREFFTLENLFDVLQSYSFLGVLSVGVLIVLISGGIDISFTAIAQVTEYALVVIIASYGGNIFVALLIACVIGTLLGSINGALIYFFNIPAIIATIATNNIFFGLLYVFSRGDVIYVVPDIFLKFSTIRFFTFTNAAGSTYGLSILTVIWMIVLGLAWFILRHTTLGRSIYAVGGNIVAARRAGFNIFRTQMFVYCFMGFLSGVAALVHTVIVQSVIPNSIVGKELDVIAAVVLGGANIAGGAGTLLGTVLGVALIASMSNGLTLMRVSSFWYNVCIGAIITISVLLSAYQLKQKEKRRVNIIVD